MTATDVVTAGNVLNNLTSETASIVKELFRASMGSPLLAAGALIIMADILEKQLKLITPDTAALLKGLATAGLGIDMASAILSDVTGIFHLNAVPNSLNGPTTLAPSYGSDAKTRLQVVKEGD